MNFYQLTQDENFIAWVLHPNKESDQYWQQWLKENPDKAELFAQSRAWVLKLHESHAASDSSLSALKKETWQAIETTILSNPSPATLQTRKRQKNIALASSIIIIAFAAFFYRYKEGAQPVADVTNTETVTHPNPLGSLAVVRSNQSDSNRTIYLADGTRVMLDPGSHLTNNLLFRDKNREVHLTGSAFFDVAHDTSRPFFVYTHGVVVKVLGTSFKILSSANTEKVLVAVRSGKVSVSAQGENKKLVTHIIEPNEQIEVNKKNSLAAKNRIQDSSMIAPPPVANLSFTFEDTPVEDIFKKLESVYDIRIEYDKSKLSKCRLTTSLDAESFYNKLSIVCVALHTSYQINGNKIQISGEGCN